MKRICRRQSPKRELKQLDQRPKYDLQTKLFVFCVKILSFYAKSLWVVFLTACKHLSVKVSFIEIDPFGAALVHVHDFGVVQTKEPQDRGMKIVDMHLVLDRMQS